MFGAGVANVADALDAAILRGLSLFIGCILLFNSVYGVTRGLCLC